MSLSAQGAQGAQGARPTVGTARIEDVRRLLSGLAADSMEGRGTGTTGSIKASIMIGEEFRSIGLEPLASGNYFQEIPFVRVELDPISRSR
jgi:hypothetical protein